MTDRTKWLLTLADELTESADGAAEAFREAAGDYERGFHSGFEEACRALAEEIRDALT